MRRLLIILMCITVSSNVLAVKSIDFYGHALTIKNDRLSSSRLDVVDKNTLHRFETSINSLEINSLHKEVDSLRSMFNLDDIGFIQLTTKVARGIYPDNNRSQFVRYSLLKKSGYRVVLTYNTNEISTFGVLGFSPSNAVYIKLKGEKFTNLDFRDYRVMGNRSIYGEVLQGRAMFINPNKKPRLNKLIKTRKLTFKYLNKNIEITARGNESLMKYIRELPTLDFDKVYLDYGVSDELRNSLFKELNRHMTGMSQKEKLAFLLNFTQQTFNYASDQKVYGAEKYNFPEETIFETYSDCDDRVILLACLYKELLGLNSVALLFREQDHVSLAVHVPGTTVGGSFSYEGRAYYVCEPTGVNYNFGRSAYPLRLVSRVYKLY